MLRSWGLTRPLGPVPSYVLHTPPIWLAVLLAGCLALASHLSHHQSLYVATSARPLTSVSHRPGVWSTKSAPLPLHRMRAHNHDEAADTTGHASTDREPPHTAAPTPLAALAAMTGAAVVGFLFPVIQRQRRKGPNLPLNEQQMYNEPCYMPQETSPCPSRRAALATAFLGFGLLVDHSSSEASDAASQPLPNPPSPPEPIEPSSSSNEVKNAEPVTDDNPTSPILASLARGLAGGATVSISKKLILFPLDTIRCRLEVSPTPRVFTDPTLYRDLYAGVVPGLLAGTPAASVFFGAKNVLGDALRTGIGLENRQLVTVLAVGGALVPCWLVKTPSEVIKTRRQAGTALNTVEEIKRVVTEEGPAALYVGYGANLLYAFPADVIKFLIYDTLKSSLHPGIPLSPLEAAVCGGASGMVAALATTPLDVIRTRLMAEADRDRYKSFWDCAVQTVEKDGWPVLMSGVGPRLTSKVLANAIQFSSFDLSQRLLGGKD